MLYNMLYIQQYAIELNDDVHLQTAQEIAKKTDQEYY